MMKVVSITDTPAAEAAVCSCGSSTSPVPADEQRSIKQLSSWVSDIVRTVPLVFLYLLRVGYLPLGVPLRPVSAPCHPGGVHDAPLRTC